MSMNSKVFNDAIHGSIEVHPLCMKFIDTPQFQRLRFINQLGSVHFVYPAATNNRFSHSIGVMYLSGQLARSLKERQPELNITDVDVLCVELAGLCHDLGHGPFSHLWEHFMSRARKSRGWRHEDCSVQVFDYLIEANNLQKEVEKYGLQDLDRVFIKEMISFKKETVSPKEWPYKGRPREKGFLYQIVSNSETGVDVDKWDYFLRDGHSLGLKVTFNYPRLIKFSRVLKVLEDGEITTKICYRDKEVTNMYDMFHARMMLHKKAYQHRVVKTIDAMLIDALLLANDHITYLGKDGNELTLCEVVDDHAAMVYLNDDVFHTIHRNNSSHHHMKMAKEIIHNILTRQYYPYVGQSSPTTNHVTSQKLLDELCKNLPASSGLGRDDFEVQLITLNYGNGKENPLMKVGLFSKEQPEVYKTHKPSEVSKMLPSVFEEYSYHVVCRRYETALMEEARVAFAKACFHLNIPNIESERVGSYARNSTETKEELVNGNGYELAL